jgi:3-oxoadipate CoA-transferase, beta subunit
LTGVACVSRIYTDLAVIDVTPAGLRVVDMVEGLDLAQLIKLSGVPLSIQRPGVPA